MDESVKKSILVVLIIISFFPLIFTVGADFSLFGNSEIVFHVSKTAAYFGFISLWWGYILGIKRFIGKFIKDISWVLNIHKWFNIIGFVILLIHPISLFFSEIYDLASLAPYFNLVNQRGIITNNVFIVFGNISLIILGIIWYTSAVVKNRLQFRFWKFIHLFTYPIFLTAFIHIQAGFLQTFIKLFGFFPIIQVYNWLLFLSFTTLVVWQFAGRMGFGIPKYKVTEVIKRAKGIISLRLTPLNYKLKPHVGQYVSVQKGRGGESHPFSISQFDEESAMLEITIKNLGRFSGDLQFTKPGAILFLNGPYGVFTREMFTRERPIVMLAGGIGVTPFMYAISQMSTNVKLQDKSIYLIYGNKTLEDIAFAQELQAQQKKFANLHVTHVLDSQPDFQGEKGFITVDLIEKYVYEDLQECDFFVCGPPIMIEKLTSALLEHGILPSHLFAEKFST